MCKEGDYSKKFKCVWGERLKKIKYVSRGEIRNTPPLPYFGVGIVPPGVFA